ncbi:thioesterase [Halostagnicola larsenii XH-48]|uniref:Thioesterase n=1 Tax=Halostagnicola larsenii XH-48 TaxID=797299 RepID=W0JPV9_9EURY|nr:thioesterase family protein [Halostagnicola larsenii]AHF99291.1 thioesterase [Halostagnicola larsenii XH-48]
MSEYAYEVAIDVRLRDVDFMGHVNNAIYATYLEEAREAYFTDIVGQSLVELDTVLASLEIEYETPIEAEQTVTVGLGVTDLGDSSIPIEYEIRAGGTRAATARSVQVFVDRETGRARSIPPELRTRLEADSV